MKEGIADAFRFIGRHPLPSAAVVLGFAVVLAISFISRSTEAMMWSGLVVGVLVGGIISSATRNADGRASKAKRRKRQ